MDDNDKPARAAHLTKESGAAVSETVTLRRLDVAGLLGDATEIILVHNGADYRLRITAANKLILTK